jgi:hypothetical protein
MDAVQDLILDKVTSPIGVVLIIFEARPEALPQIAALAIRSGNGLILKGGKEAVRSNACLHRIITSCFRPACEPELIGLVTSRGEIDELLAMKEYIDLVIPRGSNQLVSYIQNNTSIPVLGHADGICHIYIDEDVDIAEVQAALQVVGLLQTACSPCAGLWPRMQPGPCRVTIPAILRPTWLVEVGGGSTMLKHLQIPQMALVSTSGCVAGVPHLRRRQGRLPCGMQRR